MYPVSDEFLEAVVGKSRNFLHRCKFDGIEDYLDEKYIRRGTITDTIDGNNVISMGNACSKKNTMAIRDFTQPYVWRGAKFTHELGLELSEGVEWVPTGTFWVTDFSTSNDKRTIEITAYDYMYKLSKIKYVTALTAPFHYRDLLDEFLSQTGLTLETTATLPDATDEDYTILSWPEEDFTFSDIAGHLAGMLGCNARISAVDTSVIEFVWYEATGTKITNALYMGGFEKLADGALRVDTLVTGSNSEIVIENTEESTDGAIDFRPFDVVDEGEYPNLVFAVTDAEAMTASVTINSAYKSDTSAIDIPYSIGIGGEIYTVTSIPGSGFEGSKATAITLPETLVSIGGSAFDNTTNLTELTIPESVTSLGGSILTDSGVKTLYYNAVDSDGDVYGVFAGSLETCIVGEGVKTIPNGLLRGASYLTYLYLPNTVTKIGERAFMNCTSLESLTIPESVTTLGVYIILSSGVKTVYFNATAVSRTASTSALSCGALETLEVGLGVTLIPAALCRGCSGLKNVNFPISVKTIQSRAFEECSGLESVIISGGIATIGSYAFHECTALTSITFIEGLTTVADYAFTGCKGLTSIELPNSVTTIKIRGFSSCTSLTRVQIGNDADLCKISSINTYAFESDTAITDIILYVAEDAVSGSPWKATNATITWMG